MAHVQPSYGQQTSKPQTESMILSADGQLDRFTQILKGKRSYWEGNGNLKKKKEKKVRQHIHDWQVCAVEMRDVHKSKAPFTLDLQFFPIGSTLFSKIHRQISYTLFPKLQTEKEDFISRYKTQSPFKPSQHTYTHIPLCCKREAFFLPWVLWMVCLLKRF